MIDKQRFQRTGRTFRMLLDVLDAARRAEPGTTLFVSGYNHGYARQLIGQLDGMLSAGTHAAHKRETAYQITTDWGVIIRGVSHAQLKETEDGYRVAGYVGEPVFRDHYEG